ncbi:hypothetical protein PL9214290750 [Planktothrix tepida PCC 9214]|uniref:Uncharacterized protein n=1 Tax=Planktothrix tepida PCC 9214 TaxID=671072 RepID=A0A1J1LF03_9CYAN|nr:hypothetical protein PL9214290750 [Planktothrix tepida PCC 9214]
MGKHLDSGRSFSQILDIALLLGYLINYTLNLVFSLGVELEKLVLEEDKKAKIVGWDTAR